MHNINVFKVNSIASLETGISHQPCFGRNMPPCSVLNSAHKLLKCVYFKYSTTQRLHVLIIFEVRLKKCKGEMRNGHSAGAHKFPKNL